MRVQNVSARLMSCVTARHAAPSIDLGAQNREALELLIDVEIRRRLVEKQQARTLRETRREEHALPLTAAERAHDTPAELRDSRSASIAARASSRSSCRLEPSGRVRIASRQHERFGRQREVRAHALRKMRDQAGTFDRGPVVERTTGKDDRALGRRPQPGDDVDQRALARRRSGPSAPRTRPASRRS